MTFKLGHCKNALVFGAGHGIGFAIVKRLLLDYPNLSIMATFRKAALAKELHALSHAYSHRLRIAQVNPLEEGQLMSLSNEMEKRNDSLDLIFNAIGKLHDEKGKPEKSLQSFDTDHFLELVKVNSLITPLLAKAFIKNLRRDDASVFASLSAKVGSISDNKMGGWHSYRASKAALNMFIKNIAIELKRKKSKCIVLAIHPGTTKTQLSLPYIKHTSYHIHTPDETAINILNLINEKNEADSGKFLSWNGEEILW